MPRKSRIDAPGALHHIIARGIERQAIFRDDRDRDDFLERLETNSGRKPDLRVMLGHCSPIISTYCSVPEQHLFLSFMRRVLTGYAVGYNQRHRRQGHLFQNRFKSILCQEDGYLLELVRYIHLNPLRAGIVEDLESLDRYPYCGHSRLMGKVEKQLAGYGLHPQVVRGNQFRLPVGGSNSLCPRESLKGGVLILSVGG